MSLPWLTPRSVTVPLVAEVVLVASTVPFCVAVSLSCATDSRRVRSAGRRMSRCSSADCVQPATATTRGRRRRTLVEAYLSGYDARGRLRAHDDADGDPDDDEHRGAAADGPR